MSYLNDEFSSYSHSIQNTLVLGIIIGIGILPDLKTEADKGANDDRGVHDVPEIA